MLKVVDIFAQPVGAPGWFHPNGNDRLWGNSPQPSKQLRAGSSAAGVERAVVAHWHAGCLVYRVLLHPKELFK
jgi:hypothetical protein